MKKRYLAVLMAATMAFSITACGTASTDSGKEDGAQNVSEKAEDSKEGGEQTSAEESKEGKEDTADKKEEVKGPCLDITNNFYDAGENADYIFGWYPTIEVVGDNYPELKNALDSWSADYKSGYESTLEQYTLDAVQQAEDMGDDFYGYSFNYSAETARLDNRIASISIVEDSYAGGAHGYSYLYGVTFDTQTGKEITFEDLGDIRDEVKAYIDDYVAGKRKEGCPFSFYEDNIEEIMENPVWYLDGLGLNIVFNAYDIGSYAEGRTVVRIPYTELEHFNDDYKPEKETMFAKLWLSEPVDIDVDADGTVDKVELSGEYDDNGDLEICLKVNDISLDFGICAYLTGSYYVRTEDGRSFVLISCDRMSDDYFTQLVEVTSGTPEKLDEIDGKIASMSNHAFIVNTHVDALGTYSSKRTYTFSEGKLQPVEERFTFASREADPYLNGIVLKKELTVSIDEDGTMIEKELKAGTTLYPVNSDGETVVGFELEDGTYGEITFERQDYTIYIDGVSEYDLFELLPYAG